MIKLEAQNPLWGRIWELVTVGTETHGAGAQPGACYLFKARCSRISHRSLLVQKNFFKMLSLPCQNTPQQTSTPSFLSGGRLLLRGCDKANNQLQESPRRPQPRAGSRQHHSGGHRPGAAQAVTAQAGSGAPEAAPPPTLVDAHWAGRQTSLP